VPQLLFPFPVNVIAGSSACRVPTYRSSIGGRSSSSACRSTMDKALTASKNLYDYLVEFVHRRRGEPGNDMISVLAHAEHEGQKLTDDEIIAFCRFAAPGGRRDDLSSSSNLLTGLLTHPDQLDEVRSDRSLLRWRSRRIAVGAAAAHDHADLGRGNAGVRVAYRPAR